METRQVILQLRTAKGLSQEELAAKVYVTRQAVSRWETGETVPNTETLNLAPAMIVGSIPCGEAQCEEEYVEAYVNLPTALFGKGEFYILRAKGDSMEDAGITEGDLVIILRQPTAEVGDIIVALDDENQNTLKRFAGFDENGYVVLEYMNEAVYPGKVIKVKQLTVQGVAKHVLKSL